jgi:hypothetical protein
MKGPRDFHRMLTCGCRKYMSPCSGTLSSNTAVRAGRGPSFGIPERRSHRRDYRRIKEVQFKRDCTRALHGLAGGPCICRSIWREDGRSFSSWYAPVLVGLNLAKPEISAKQHWGSSSVAWLISRQDKMIVKTFVYSVRRVRRNGLKLE